MTGSGLTPFALLFMLISMLSVTALMVYCFWRILRGGDVTYEAASPESGGGTDGPVTGGGAREPSGGGEG